MKSRRDIDKMADEVLTCCDATVSLLRGFLDHESNAQETILLVCARLDSLANLAFPQGTQKQRFLKSLLNHSRFRNLFGAVSAGDLYSYLRYHLWMLPGTVDKPGRLHAFNPDDDRELMNMLWGSELAITQQKIGCLLKFLLHNLSSQWRLVWLDDAPIRGSLRLLRCIDLRHRSKAASEELLAACDPKNPIKTQAVTCPGFWGQSLIGD